jgi:hypothetical protein
MIKVFNFIGLLKGSGHSVAAPPMMGGGGGLQEEMARKLAARMNKSSGGPSNPAPKVNNPPLPKPQANSKWNFLNFSLCSKNTISCSTHS